jgi:hypothetical protein
MRRLFPALVFLSLLLCVPIISLWIRSYRHWDHLSNVSETIVQTGTAAQRQPAVVVYSESGSIIKTRAMFDPRTGRFGLLPGSSFEVSYSGLFAFALSPPLICVVLWLMRRCYITHPPGRCANCGYDLRATPERCPECGMTALKIS